MVLRGKQQLKGSPEEQVRALGHLLLDSSSERPTQKLRTEQTFVIISNWCLMIFLSKQTLFRYFHIDQQIATVVRYFH